MPKPVVSAVNGPAAGIGCSLALSADLIVAAHSSFFLLAFVNIGLVPDGGSTAFVPARIGLARATEMMMLGERVGAEQALEWGLVNKVVPDESLMSESRALVERLAKGPTRSYAGAKELLNRRVYARPRRPARGRGRPAARDGPARRTSSRASWPSHRSASPISRATELPGQQLRASSTPGRGRC